MTMTETETTETADAVDIPADLSTLTVPQLREIVEAAALDVPKSAPKAALVEALVDYRLRVQATLDETRRQGEEPEEVEGEAVVESDEPISGDVAEAESTALALREEPVVAVPALLPSEAEFDAMLTIAARIASTQMVPTAYRGKPDDVLAAILTGREMGLGPMQSLRDIYVVDGKPSLSANLLLARLREGGVVILESECDNERAWCRARRRDTGEVANVEWTYEEAEKITYRKKGGATGRLVEKDNWVNYRPDMLWARMVGRLARRLGPDLIGAAMPYTSEEVQDWDSAADAPADSGARPHGDDRQTGTWISPTKWSELVDRLSSDLVLGRSAGAWMEELAEKAYRQPSVSALLRDAEVPDDKKRDLFRRLLAVLRSLEEAGVDPFGVSSLPDPRRTIQEAIAAAFDNALALDGPAWALSAAEQEAGRPARPEAAGSDLPPSPAPATATSTEPQEAADGAEEPPGAAPEQTGGDDIDRLAF